MANLFWYICLAIIGVGSITYTVYMKRNTYKVSTLLVFALAVACATWIAEFTVLGLFNSYAYKTGLFADTWAQNLLGHLLLNTTIYPASAIVLVAYSLKNTWIFLIAALFTFTEYLFVKLRIYEQHWWRYYMTFIGVVIFLSVAKRWFVKINQKCSPLTRTITFYFVAMIIIHIPAPILLLLGKQYYQLSLVNNLVGNLYLSSIIIIFFYHMVEAFLLVLFTSILKKKYWIILPFIITIVAQFIFAKTGILIFEDRWNLVYTVLINEIFITLYILIEKYTLKPNLN